MKKKLLFLLFFFPAIFLFSSLKALPYYWVGGGGNWSELFHWATTSGGSVYYNIVPSANDDVIFDANSGFIPASKTVTINCNASCRNMDWTGALNSPVLTGSSPNTLNIYGSLTFIPAMSFTFSNVVTFAATTPGNTITMAGQSFSYNTYFNGTGGWILQDAFTVSGGVIFLYHQQGSLNTNGKTLTTPLFSSTGSLTRALTLGSSTVNVTFNNPIASPFSVWSISSTALTFDAGTSTINITGSTVSGGAVVLNTSGGILA